MSDHEQQDSIEQAFEALRGEVSLARRAVEQLTVERERSDYSETMAKMTAAMEQVLAAQRQIAKSPALQLTPDAVASEMLRLSSAVRSDDARTIKEAYAGLLNSVGAVDMVVRRGQSVDRNLENEAWMCGLGIILGILLWSMLPGMLARALPESWHVPEWMAARTMRMDARAAGERLVALTGAARAAEGRGAEVAEPVRAREAGRRARERRRPGHSRRRIVVDAVEHGIAVPFVDRRLPPANRSETDLDLPGKRAVGDTAVESRAAEAREGQDLFQPHEAVGGCCGHGGFAPVG